MPNCLPLFGTVGTTAAITFVFVFFCLFFFLLSLLG
jgi:hypothetical protein